MSGTIAEIEFAVRDNREVPKIPRSIVTNVFYPLQ